MNQVELAKAAQAIGYAIGAMSGLADTAELNEVQKDVLDSAVSGLRDIDLLKLTVQGDE